MLHPMSSLSSIDASRAYPESSAAATIGEACDSPSDLRAAVNDDTRRLLARRRIERRTRLVPRALALADILGLSLAYLLATVTWGSDGALRSAREWLVFGLTLPIWILLAKLHGLYDRDQERPGHSTIDDVVSVVHTVTIGTLLLLVASHLAGGTGSAIYPFITFWAIALCIVLLARALARGACRRTRAYTQNAVIVGAGHVGQLLARKLVKHPEYGVNLVGFVDRDPLPRRVDLPEDLTVLGSPERLPEIVKELDIERVIIAFSNDSPSELVTVSHDLQALPVQIDLIPWLFELVSPRVTVHSVEGMPLLGLPPQRPTRISLMIKRAIDVTIAATALIVLSPVLAYIALRIRLDSEGPVFFRQTRFGANMKEFTALKFRSMKVNTDQSVHRAAIQLSMTADAETSKTGLFKLERSDSVTKFGRWLRSTSLDELPQLINVVRGDMSLVGPRPCIPYEVENFEPLHFERFGMPQGITGLWQVTARANCPYNEALGLDVAYVRGWSLGLDLRLLLRTPLEVLRQRSATL